MTLKEQLKNIAFRIMRPGLLDVNRRLELIEVKALARARAKVAPAAAPTPPASESSGPGVWRGGVSGLATRSNGAPDWDATAKLSDELGYWVGVARGQDPGFPGDFHEVFAQWQRIRLKELADQLKMDGPAFESWAARSTVVEIGGGPHPAVSEARWKRAVAVDPLVDGYAAEGLFPESAARVVHLAATGESIPLASAIADLVIIENALDHVEDPRAVVGEIARLLVPGGFVWLLVDLMDYKDHMHPSPMSEARLRELMTGAGFESVYLASWDGASHPMAKQQCRSLWTKK